MWGKIQELFGKISAFLQNAEQVQETERHKRNRGSCTSSDIRNDLLQLEMALLRKENGLLQKELELVRREQGLSEGNRVSSAVTKSPDSSVIQKIHPSIGIVMALQEMGASIPKFSGDRYHNLECWSGELTSFSKWKKSLQLIRNLHQLDDVATRLLIHSKLSHSAAIWFASEPENVILSIDELLNAMEKKYSDVRIKQNSS